MSDTHNLDVYEHPGLSLKSSVFAFVASTTVMILLMIVVGNL